MQAHLAFDHVHGFVARVDVKLAAVFAAAGDEGEGVVVLPQNSDTLAALCKLLRDFCEIDDRHGYHRRGSFVQGFKVQKFNVRIGRTL